MPELPEVESWRQLAEKHLLHQKIIAVHPFDDPIVMERVPGACFTEALTTRRVTAIKRHGKHLWMTFDRKPCLYVHFAMTGSFQVYNDLRERPRFLKLELVTANNVRLGYINIRRFGRLRLQDDPEEEAPISTLGPDALTGDLNAAYFQTALCKRKAPVKALLLDQKLFAGVGNWIADEMLYQAEIAPHRPGNELSHKACAKLSTALAQILKKAVAVHADSNRFPKTWLFHRRWSHPHSSTGFRDESLRFDTIGGRTSAWDPKRQK